jgi:hypothetical protein
MVLALIATRADPHAALLGDHLSLRDGQLPISPLTQAVGGKLTDGKRAPTVGTATANMKHTRRFFD